MPDRSVEQRLAALEALLADPQTMRNRLERTFDPRGGEPRVVDAAGRTLPYEPAIQFLNATATVDPRKQRIIVTPTGGGGGGGMAGEFSDDGATTDAERMKFTDQTNPAINHLTLDTQTLGSTRVAVLLLTEDTTALGADPFTLLGMQQDTANLNARVDLGAEAVAGGDVRVQIEATHIDDGSQGRLILRSNSSSDSLVTLSSKGASTASTIIQATEQASGMSASVGVAPLAGGALVSADQSGSAQPGRTLYDDAGISNFTQAEVDTTNPAGVSRIMRGPFTAAVGAVGAAGTGMTALTNARRGTNYVVIGGSTGGAGAENVVWSWEDLGAEDVQINYTNVDLLSAHTVEFAFYVISTT